MKIVLKLYFEVPCFKKNKTKYSLSFHCSVRSFVINLFFSYTGLGHMKLLKLLVYEDFSYCRLLDCFILFSTFSKYCFLLPFYQNSHYLTLIVSTFS